MNLILASFGMFLCAGLFNGIGNSFARQRDDGGAIICGFLACVFGFIAIAGFVVAFVRAWHG